jgi:hypothetical protein
MNWLYYLLEANLYLAVFYGYYRLFLHQETFYSINRYYLIIATCISFALPLFQVGYINRYFPAAPIVTASAAQPEAGSSRLSSSALSSSGLVSPDHVSPAITGTSSPEAATLQPVPMQEGPITNILKHISISPLLSNLFLAIYLVIASGFLIKMMISLFQILHIFTHANKTKAGEVIYVELDSTQTAFSFFNMLFINPGLSRKETVLEHELVHIRQNHTVDVLFFELVQIVSWFNPVTYLIKEDIKLVHEYIADELTTDTGIQKHDYALFIIENSFGIIPNQLSNQIFNQSLIKRRINMLNKQKSGGLAKLRFLLLLPLTSGLLLTSTMAFSKEYLLVDLLPAPSVTGTSIQRSVKQPFTYSASDNVKDRSGIFILKIAFAGKGAEEVMTNVDERAIYLNGELITARNFWGVGDYSTKKILSPVAAAKKYGSAAKYGALEFTGSQIKLVNNKIYSPQAPPPPPIVKFPLPKHPNVPSAPTAPSKVKFALPKKPATPPAPPKEKSSQPTTAPDGVPEIQITTPAEPVPASLHEEIEIALLKKTVAPAEPSGFKIMPRNRPATQLALTDVKIMAADQPALTAVKIMPAKKPVLTNVKITAADQPAAQPAVKKITIIPADRPTLTGVKIMSAKKPVLTNLKITASDQPAAQPALKKITIMPADQPTLRNVEIMPAKKPALTNLKIMATKKQ